MKKKFIKTLIFLSFVATIFSTNVLLPYPVADAQNSIPVRSDGTTVSQPSTQPTTNQGGIDNVGTDGDSCGISNPGCWIIRVISKAVSSVLLGTMSLITQLAGWGLNWSMKYTIVDMAKNYGAIEGNGNTLTNTWKTVRDVANMGFIFILLYTSIKMILGAGGDVYRLIKNVIIAAILINFSFFITRVIIDLANVLAVTFYSAIVPAGIDNVKTGIASAYVDLLRLTTIWNNPAGITNTSIITVGIMGSIVLLIAAFSFFAITIMLIIRYVILLLVMVLSPIAFVANIFPGLDGQGKQWWQALYGQAFFAPIYLFLSWISIKILQGVVPSKGSWAETFKGTEGGVYPTGAIELFIYFGIVIVFMITSLILAKNWANKAGSQVTKLTGTAFGLAGAASFGLAGRAGRSTIGRAGNTIGENDWLKKKVEEGGAKGAMARLALATGRKTSKANFDVRGTAIGANLGAGKAQKGGYAEFIKNKTEEEAKFATSLAPSDKTKARAESRYKDVETEYKATVDRFGENSQQAKDLLEKRNTERARRDTLLGNKKDIDKRVDDLETEKKNKISQAKNTEELRRAETQEKSAYDTVSKLEVEAEKAEGEVKDEKLKELEIAKGKLKDIQGTASEARKKVKEEVDKLTTDYDRRKSNLKKTEIEPAGDARKKNFANNVEKSRWAKFRGYNYQAAAKIRKGKSAGEEAAEALKKLQKEGVIKADEPETPAPAKDGSGGGEENKK